MPQSPPKTKSSLFMPFATLHNKGKILFGTPLGFSPNLPEGCAPIGLK